MIGSPMNEAEETQIHSVTAEEIVLWKSDWIFNGRPVLNWNLVQLKSIKVS